MQKSISLKYEPSSEEGFTSTAEYSAPSCREGESWSRRGCVANMQAHIAVVRDKPFSLPGDAGA